MSIVVNIDGYGCEIPEKYREQFNEGRSARGNKVKLIHNPYQSTYSRTGTTEDLWRAVAWAQGWKGSAR